MSKPKKAAPKKRGPGRPRFVATDADRFLVRTAVAGGVTQADICAMLGPSGITEKTLYKHFRHELDTGLARANTLVAGAVYKAALRGNAGAQALWVKCRAGWKEPKQQIEHSGSILNLTPEQMAALNDEQLATLNGILAVLAGVPPAAGGDPQTGS